MKLRITVAVIAAGILAALTIAACGTNTTRTPAAEPAAETQTAETVDTPSPTPTIPDLWPTKVVDAMPPDMVAKYTTRIASADAEPGDPNRYYYFAHTLPDMPLYICITLAANSADQPWGALSAAAEDVLTRADQYVAQSGSTVQVRSNHTTYNAPKDYVTFLAMDDEQLVDLSLTHFCPAMRPVWDKARAGVEEFAAQDAAQKSEQQYNATHPFKAFDDGRYTVGAEPGMIQPGTYKLPGPLSDCYWERSTGNGTIIDNAFVTNAPQGVRVTVHAGEGFTSQNCTGGNKWQKLG